MPKAIMMVWSSPSDPAREAEFNEWYDTVHAADVLKLDGMVSCTRFKVASTQFAEQELPGTHVAYYEVDTDDLSQIPVRFVEAFAAGELPISDVIAPGPIVLLEQVSDRLT